jgi:hypothetical protein
MEMDEVHQQDASNRLATDGNEIAEFEDGSMEDVELGDVHADSVGRESDVGWWDYGMRLVAGRTERGGGGGVGRGFSRGIGRGVGRLFERVLRRGVGRGVGMGVGMGVEMGGASGRGLGRNVGGKDVRGTNSSPKPHSKKLIQIRLNRNLPILTIWVKIDVGISLELSLANDFQDGNLTPNFDGIRELCKACASEDKETVGREVVRFILVRSYSIFRLKRRTIV